MNQMPSRELVESIRQRYPKGSRVELIEMNDPYTNLRPGDTGTVACLDDIGTIHIQWDNGACLGAAYGEDRVKKI